MLPSICFVLSNLVNHSCHIVELYKGVHHRIAVVVIEIPSCCDIIPCCRDLLVGCY